MNKHFLSIVLATCIILNACSENPTTQQKNSARDNMVAPLASKENSSISASPGSGKADDCAGPAAIEKLKKNTSLATLAGMTEEEAKEWRPGDKNGITDFWVDTLFNDHCVLCIRAGIDCMGAYPSHANEYHVYNLHTGEAIPVAQVLDQTKIPELVGICNKRLQQSIQKDRAERMVTDKEDISDFDDAIKSYPSEFTAADLKVYYFTPDAIVFIHEFGFPHVIQALEPDGEIKFFRKDFKTYLMPGCPLDF